MSGSDSPSDALRAVIEPLLNLIDRGHREIDRLQNAVDLGREAWNLEVKASGGGGELEAALDRACERFARDDVPAGEVRPVLRMLIDRKRVLFPDDDRLLLEAIAIETESGPQLKVTWARFSRMH